MSDASEVPDCSAWTRLDFPEEAIELSVPACWYAAATPQALKLLREPRAPVRNMLQARVFDCAGSVEDMLCQCGGEVFEGIAAPAWKDGVAVTRAAIQMRAWVVRGWTPSERVLADMQPCLLRVFREESGVEEVQEDTVAEEHGARTWSITRLYVGFHGSDYSGLQYGVACVTPCRWGTLVLVFFSRAPGNDMRDVLPGVLARAIIRE